MVEREIAKENSAHRHETRDASVRRIIGYGVGLVAVILIATAAVIGLFDYFSATQPKSRPPSRLYRSGQLPPEPRLQVTPQEDLKKMLSGQDTILNSYDWVDPKNGIVRIPIDRAMDVLVERLKGKDKVGKG